jgi:hypothetical protein
MDWLRSFFERTRVAAVAVALQSILLGPEAGREDHQLEAGASGIAAADRFVCGPRTR